MVPNPSPQDVALTPPPPLQAWQAHLGLTTKAIAAKNGHSGVGVWQAIKRLGVKPLLFMGVRLYSQEQALFLRDRMRKPELRPRTRHVTTAKA